MRRRLLALLAITLCLMCSMPAGAASFTKAHAGIKYGGAVYRIGDTNTKWKTRLGKYTRKLNETDGVLSSYTYTFKGRGVRVTTLYSRKLRKEKITSILIWGPKVSTVGGLKVGRGYKKMTSIIGKKYTKRSGVYTYKAGARRLQVKASGGKIRQIKLT